MHPRDRIAVPCSTSSYCSTRAGTGPTGKESANPNRGLKNRIDIGIRTPARLTQPIVRSPERRLAHRHLLLLVLDGLVRPVGEKVLHDLHVAPHRRPVQRGVVAEIEAVHVRAGLDEILDGVEVPVVGSAVQGGVLHLGNFKMYFDSYARIHSNIRGKMECCVFNSWGTGNGKAAGARPPFCRARARSAIELSGSISHHSGLLNVGPLVEEQLDDREVAITRTQNEGGVSAVVRLVQGRALNRLKQIGGVKNTRDIGAR